jgi:hypothetical protein
MSVIGERANRIGGSIGVLDHAADAPVESRSFEA